MTCPARHVLVIESDVALMNRIVPELYEAGFTTRLATTPAEVVAELGCQPFPVCILLCLDGIEARRVLAHVKKAHCHKIPVVLIAPPNAPGIPGRFVVDAVISKPPAPGAVARIAASFGASGGVAPSDGSEVVRGRSTPG